MIAYHDHGATCIAPEIPRRRFEENIPAIKARHGFLTKADLADIVGFDRLRQVLVRCGGCRFQCPAQDFAHLERCIEAGGDYVRDVSLPTTDPIWGPRANH
jgi:hypothetical protein